MAIASVSLEGPIFVYNCPNIRNASYRLPDLNLKQIIYNLVAKMNSSYQIPTSSSFASSYYHSFEEGTKEIKPVSLRRCDDDFLTVVGLYDGFWKTVPENPENNFAHSHGGTAKKLYGSGGFSNATQISDKGVAKISRIFPGSDQFDEKRFHRDLITELRICLWEPMRNHPNIIDLEDIQWFPGPHPSIENN